MKPFNIGINNNDIWKTSKKVVRNTFTILTKEWHRKKRSWKPLKKAPPALEKQRDGVGHRLILRYRAGRGQISGCGIFSPPLVSGHTSGVCLWGNLDEDKGLGGKHSPIALGLFLLWGEGRKKKASSRQYISVKTNKQQQEIPYCISHVNMSLWESQDVQFCI